MAEDIDYDEIVYDGKSRNPILMLKDSGLYKERTVHSLNGILLEYPEISYGSEWCSYEESNNSWLIKKINTFAGGDGSSTPGKILRLLAGNKFQEPILTNQWTQILARIGDDARLTLKFKIVVFPRMHEGLKDDRSNIGLFLSGMSRSQDWLTMIRDVIMPKSFGGAGIITDNLKAVANNVFNGDSNVTSAFNAGRKLIGGAEEAVKTIKNAIEDDTSGAQSWNAITSTLTSSMSSLGNIANALGNIRNMTTFKVMIKKFNGNDYNGNPAFISMLDSGSTDFYVESANVTISPHLLNDFKDDHHTETNGAKPEWTQIELTLKSVELLSDTIFKSIIKAN